MVNKKKTAKMKSENELYILPSSNDEMKLFITKFKIDMMEHIIISIKYAIDNKLSLIEVFQFKNSPFVITLSEKEFGANLEHIHKFFMDNEIYELCKKIEKLQEILKKKTDEKENPDK